MNAPNVTGTVIHSQPMKNAASAAAMPTSSGRGSLRSS